MNDDLISRGKLKKHYAWWRGTENGRKMADLFDEIVDAQPTAEVPDRKVGKWVDDKGLYMCSCCKRLWPELWWTAYCPMDRMYKTMPFCPNCGAKMEDTP